MRASCVRKKERDGEQIDHFLNTTFAAILASELVGNATPISKTFQFDDRVYEDYVRFLLPRAVGFSAALLDYFFRGRLKGVMTRIEGPSGYLEDFENTNRPGSRRLRSPFIGMKVYLESPTDEAVRRLVGWLELIFSPTPPDSPRS